MITIHEAKAADFATLGLGALLPSECTVRERAGGMYELKIVHPITTDGRHHRIKPMRIIKAPAPVRETPLVEIDQTGTIYRDIYKVVTDGRRLYLRVNPYQESKGLHAYKPGTEVAALDLSSDGKWRRVAILDGGATGWMWAGNLEFVRTEIENIVGDTPGGVVQPRQTREQLFRVYFYSPDTKTRTITAEARHITYDLAGAVVDGKYSPENVPANQVCAQIMARADHDVSDFHIYCTITDPISGEYGGRNILDCLLDPETGIVAQTKARIVRDNYDIFILPDDVRSRGVELRYGKNLLSAYMDTDTSNTITRIKPVGKTKDGEQLYIEENNGWVESPYINDYPVVYSKEVEYDVVESDDLPINQARTLLKEKAEADFAAGCDTATVRLDADFVRLELTEEYRHLANQYALHLYDSVPVTDREADIVATARMTEYVYDAILDQYQDTGLGELDEVKSTIYGYELAAGTVSGGKLIPNTVNGDRLQNLSVSYGKFDLAAIKHLSADAITAIRADIRELVAGNITTDQLYADLATIAAAQITAANIEKANIQWAQIENLSAEIAKVVHAEIGNLEVDWAGIYEADIEWANITNLTAEIAKITAATIEKAKINWAQIVDVKIGTADIEDATITTAKIALGAITSALIKAGAIGTAQIADGSITSAKIVELSADVIKSGTLSTDRLLIKGTGGLFYEINATAGGLTSTQLTQEQYKNAISGTALVARSVTADKIAAKTITANEIMSGTITAAEINVANLFAADATIAALNNYILRTQTIEAIEGKLDVWASEKIKLAVDDVQVGGTNLIRNTGTLKTANYLIDESGASARGSCTEDEFGGFHVVCKNENIRCWMGDYAVTPGQSYAMSVRYRINTAGNQAIQFQYVLKSAGGADLYFWDSVNHSTTSTITEDGWTVLRSVFTAPDDPAVAKVSLAIRTGLDGWLYTCDYNIRRPKFEIGNKATAWSPAPEDTDAAIDELSAALVVQAGKITANATKIETVGQAAGNAQNAANAAQNAANAAQNAANGAQGTANSAVTEVTKAQQSISALNSAITTKVSKEDFDALGRLVSAQETKIEQTDEQVLILAGRTVGGTNLVRCGDGTIGIMTGAIDRNWTKSAFCRSGTGIILRPFASAYNGVHFYTDVTAAPGEYMLSFWCWTHGTDIQPVLRCNLFSGADGVDHYFRDVVVTPNDPVRYMIPISVAYSATVNLRMLTWSKWTTGELYITDVKLEKGNTATDWSPSPDDPSNGLDTGANSSVKVRITPDTFDVDVPGTDGDFTLNRTGARIPVVNSDVVYAQNLAYRYGGAADIYVNAGASGDQIAAGSHYRSLTDALNALNGKYLTYDVYIYLESDVYGDTELTAMSGRSVIIIGNGHTLYGALKAHNTSIGMDINGLTINRPASSGNPHALELSRCWYVGMYQCRFIAAGVDAAVNIGQGVRTFMYECELRGADKLIYLWYCCDLQALNLRGGDCSKYLVVNGATARMGGTRPDGTWEVWNISDLLPGDPNTLPIDYGTATPSVPVISTASWSYLYSDSYAGKWGIPNQDAAQGVIRTDSSGTTAAVYGTIWFDAAAIRSALSGKTIKQASLRLTMLKGYGRDTTVSVQLYGTNQAYSGRSGQPALTTSYGTIGTTEPGTVSEITIPTAVISDIVNGTIQALVLKSDDSELYKDRDYSKNYARFAGSATADGNTCPRLTVVYQ